MKPFGAARRVLLSKLLKIVFLILSCPAYGTNIGPKFDCGTYKVQGVVGYNGANEFIMTINAGTMSAYEILLLGGSSQELFRNIGKFSAMKVYVPSPISDNSRPYTLFQSWASPEIMTKSPSMLIELEACELPNKFVRPLSK